MTRRRRGRRKSPYKHDVREHFRNGRRVLQYERGKGKKPRQRVRMPPAPSAVKKTKTKGVSSGIDVRFEYFDFGSENVDVDSKDFPGAIDAGFENRKQFRAPKLINLRRL